ncbi:MAG: acetyltransferase [Lachnospiraceae bacterium]|nr:acetyltransferase [Lachnospiraceae bacterium]
MKRIILIGASGHGKVCAEIASLNGYAKILFLDDNRELKTCGNYKVVGTTDNLYENIDEQTEFFVSIGNANYRKPIQEKIEKAGGKIATLIHPNAVVSSDVTLGVGSVVMAGAVINAGTKIGKGVIVNTSSSIDHDCNVGDYCHIAVGAHVCGTVNIGEMTWIGAGATISNNLEICQKCTIGAGATVIRDIEDEVTVVGNPAKVIKRHTV